MKITVSKENYLKTIAEAEAEGKTVIAATLARRLKVSAPAVTMAVRRLKRDKLITSSKSGQIQLTGEGRQIAERLLFRHHLIERMLTEIFGMEWYKVHEEAEQLEHAVSADFERRLVEKLGPGPACPHGNLIGIDSPEQRRSRGWKPLEEAREGEALRIASVYERDRDLLEYLDGLGLRPAARLRVLARNYDQTLSLEVQGGTVQLGLPAAARIWVAQDNSTHRKIID